MKTSELQGAALDWAVAKCEGVALDPNLLKDGHAVKFRFEPSTDWAQGGPIIEREKIGIDCDDEGVWFASYDLSTETSFGVSSKSPLIAAMRCYVASKLGAEINIPEEIE